MSKDEINKAIAEKVMGWTNTKTIGFAYWKEPGLYGDEWNPYERWDHAGMVVEKGLWFDGFCLFRYGDGYAIGKFGDFNFKPIISASTAPAAICMAALKVVEEKS